VVKKHIDTTVVKTGKSLSINKRYSTLTINKAGPTGPSLSHLDYCSYCGQVSQRGTWEIYNWLRTGQHGWPLNVHGGKTLLTCQSFMTQWKRLTSLLVFVSVDKRNVLSCRFKLLAHSWDTHAYPTRHLQSRSPEQIMGGAKYHIEPWLHVTDASSKVNTPYGSAWTVKTQRYMCTHALAHTHTYRYGGIIHFVVCSYSNVAIFWW
jgi:hypothetical protein